jgi:hypothetical protein
VGLHGSDPGVGPGDDDGACRKLLRAANTVHVPVSGLTTDAVASWLAAEPATQAWVRHADDLVQQTGGNPFYIRTLISELSHPGADISATLTYRPTWRTVLVAPCRALPEPVRHTIATAAVMGERLAPGVLADALDRPVQEVSDHLARAVTAGILHFGTTGLAFNHALVRDAISPISGLPNARGHAGVAAAIEHTGGTAHGRACGDPLVPRRRARGRSAVLRPRGDGGADPGPGTRARSRRRCAGELVRASRQTRGCYLRARPGSWALDPPKHSSGVPHVAGRSRKWPAAVWRP